MIYEARTLVVLTRKNILFCRCCNACHDNMEDTVLYRLGLGECRIPLVFFTSVKIENVDYRVGRQLKDTAND